MVRSSGDFFLRTACVAVAPVNVGCERGSRIPDNRILKQFFYPLRLTFVFSSLYSFGFLERHSVE